MAQFSQSTLDDGTAVLSVTGDVDLAEADAFVEAARECLARARGVDLDLSGVTFIDSSGLGALVRLRNDAAALAKPLHLANVSRSVDRLLQVTGLDDSFERRP